MRLRAQGHISQESRSAVGRLHSAPATAPVRVVAPAKVARPHRAAGQKARPEGRPLCASYQSGRSGGHADSTTDKSAPGPEYLAMLRAACPSAPYKYNPLEILERTSQLGHVAG